MGAFLETVSTPETMCSPSGEIATLETQSVWPSRMHNTAPVVTGGLMRRRKAIHQSGHSRPFHVDTHLNSIPIFDALGKPNKNSKR